MWENHDGPYQSESYEEPVVTKGVFLYVINVCGEAELFVMVASCKVNDGKYFFISQVH